ncbi:hypothetical protein FDK12_01975 [Arthrobacter sp. NamB2]|uniref:DUF6541 family protein n=1 Tax=Arthrobacter sp. NamB2 TaxID=2576035 RepID=UPI0010C99AD3|nr:DUF6541 family protein [Arthrobacter sp. NamB2]TKV29705.1 hypothetical protein FDK12_01975 [Arthrobacter sp. NamB2]
MGNGMWAAAVPEILLALGVLFLPGLTVGVAGFGLRGFNALAVAPLLSMSFIALGAIAADLAGIDWSLLPVVVLMVVALLVGLVPLLALRKTEKPREALSGRDLLLPLAGLAVAVFLLARRLFFAFGSPENFSQTFDNIFHLNAIQYIAQTKSASSLTLGDMTGIDFYPAGWHGVVSLVHMLAGSSIPVSVNAVNLVVAAVVWPAGCLYLVQSMVGARWATLLLTGVLSAAFGSFPLLLLDFGVLYPNFLGVCLLPAVLALLVNALGLASGATPRVIVWVLFLASLPGLALSHPSAVAALIAFSVPLALVVFAKALLRQRSTRRRSLVSALVAVASLAVFWYLLTIVWGLLRPAEESLIWLPVQTQPQAVGEFLLAGPLGAPPIWAVAVMTAVGLGVLISQVRHLWMVGVYIVGAGLFVVATGAPDGDFRDLITGAWYTDTVRLASLLPIVTIPIAAVGGGAIAGLLVEWAISIWRRVDAPRPEGRWQVAVSVAAAGVLVATGTLLTQGENIRAAARSAAAGYQLTSDSLLVSSDEYELMQRLDELIPEDAVIAGNPWTGSSLAYAFADRRPLQLHTLAILPPEALEVYADLRDADTDPEACAAILEEGVEYVLDFGDREVHGGYHAHPGLEELETSDAVELVESVGRAKLYQVTACGVD